MVTIKFSTKNYNLFYENLTLFIITLFLQMHVCFNFAELQPSHPGYYYIRMWFIS
jgi:hypothetical protein